jgi:secreted Zn-dependent insulinase-like peptidase
MPKVSKAHIIARTFNTYGLGSALERVHAKLLPLVLKSQLRELLYQSLLAGYTYNVGFNGTGLSIRVSGYSDKLDIVLQSVMDKMFMTTEWDEVSSSVALS